MMTAVLVITVIVMMLIVVMALKCADAIFLQSAHCAEKCLQQVRVCGNDAVVCISRARHRVLATCNTCGMLCEEERAIYFNRVETAIVLLDYISG